MKKILLMLTLAIATIGVKAQTAYYTTHTSIAILNEAKNVWEWTPNEVQVMTITISPNKVVIANKVGTTLYITGDGVDSKVEGGKETKWQATDQDGTKCIFSIIVYDDKSSPHCHLSYSDIKVCYVMRQNY